jgi:hypothetical protein
MDQKPGTSSTPPPPRPKPTVVDYYSRRAAEEARRFQQSLTRDNIVSFVKTIVWVVPLTLLIWVYAEQQQQVALPYVQASFEVRSSDPNRTVTLISPKEKQIECDLWGPHSNLEHVRDSLTVNNPLMIDIDASTPLGQQSIPTLQKIENNSRFRDEGITVEKASPDYIQVFIDKLETKEVPIEAPSGLLSLQSATFTPATVNITGPATVLEKGGLSVVADIAGLPILNSPGQHAPVAVPLVLMPADSRDQVNLSANTVQATLSVKDADVPYTATNVPVNIVATPDFLNRYKVVFDDPLMAQLYPSIALVGPPEQIEQLSTKQVSPIAALEIDNDDVKAPKTKKLMILNLPPGVRLAPGQDPEISFTVMER